MITAILKYLIRKAYTAFNERDIDKALSTMQPDVQWSKAWEGGYISGQNRWILNWWMNIRQYSIRRSGPTYHSINSALPCWIEYQADTWLGDRPSCRDARGPR